MCVVKTSFFFFKFALNIVLRFIHSYFTCVYFLGNPRIPQCHLNTALFLCRVLESSLCTLCPKCCDHGSVPGSCSTPIPPDLQCQEAMHGKTHQSARLAESSNIKSETCWLSDLMLHYWSKRISHNRLIFGKLNL